jgi:hypothetical protein
MSMGDYTSDLADDNATPTTIAGIGDTAVFTQSGLVVAGVGPMPDVYVHQGAATWAAQAAGLCTDIFTAIKA